MQGESCGCHLSQPRVFFFLHGTTLFAHVEMVPSMCEVRAHCPQYLTFCHLPLSTRLCTSVQSPTQQTLVPDTHTHLHKPQECPNGTGVTGNHVTFIGFGMFWGEDLN